MFGKKAIIEFPLRGRIQWNKLHSLFNCRETECNTFDIKCLWEFSLQIIEAKLDLLQFQYKCSKFVKGQFSMSCWIVFHPTSIRSLLGASKLLFVWALSRLFRDQLAKLPSLPISFLFTAIIVQHPRVLASNNCLNIYWRSVLNIKMFNIKYLFFYLYVVVKSELQLTKMERIIRKW